MYYSYDDKRTKENVRSKYASQQNHHWLYPEQTSLPSYESHSHHRSNHRKCKDCILTFLLLLLLVTSFRVLLLVIVVTITITLGGTSTQTHTTIRESIVTTLNISVIFLPNTSCRSTSPSRRRRKMSNVSRHHHEVPTSWCERILSRTFDCHCRVFDVRVPVVVFVSR